MTSVERDLTKLKLEISPFWRVLFRHKWRRPAWIRYPRSVMEDVRFIRLSDRAKAAWPIILLIASEDINAKLPNAETVYRHLQRVGIQLNSVSFLKLIDEYIQGDFILKTTPELQSYREQITESKKDIYAPTTTRSPAKLRELSALCVSKDSNQRDKRLSEEERRENPQPLAQPKLDAFETVEFIPPAAPESKSLTYQEAQALGISPPVGRFEKPRGRW